MSLSISNRVDAPPRHQSWMADVSATPAMAVCWAGTFLWMYAGVLRDLANQWATDEMYSYGFLVPAVSLYFVWLRRDRLRTVVPRPIPAVGFGIVFVGVVMLVIGHAGGVAAAEQLSLMPVLVGSVLIFGGREALKVLWMPIAYLLLMIPIWEVLTDRLHEPFQNFSAGIGLALIRSLGIPVYRDGLYLALPNITLEVAKACSGVNYLIAVIAVGIPLAALYLQGWARRIGLLSIAVLVAVLANGLRVALIGVLAYYDLGGSLHGPSHMLHGVFVSFIGFGALFAGVWVLSERRLPDSPERAAVVNEKPAGPRSSVGPGTVKTAGWGAPLLFAGAAVVMQFFGVIAVAPAQEFRRFPLQIGAWDGRDIHWKMDDPYRLRGLDHALAREYQRHDGPPVRLFVGYFERQSQGEELISGDARRLYQRSEGVEARVGSNGLQEIRWLVTGEETGRTLLLYWYDLHGGTVTNPTTMQARLAWNALVDRRANGALIAIEVPLAEADDPSIARSHALRFIEDSAPILEQWLPRDVS